VLLFPTAVPTSIPDSAGAAPLFAGPVSGKACLEIRFLSEIRFLETGSDPLRNPVSFYAELRTGTGLHAGSGRPKRIRNREHAQITRIIKWEFVKLVQLVAFVMKKRSP
jgi:hypothetical protein